MITGKIWKSRKAQVTLFVIIGIFILTVSGILFYMRSAKLPLEQERQVIVESIPTMFLSVNNFVESCIREEAVKALTKMGETGGFVDIEEQGITAAAGPTSSAAVQFLPGSLMKTAYWHYLESDNSCTSNCKFVLLPENKLSLYKKTGKVSIESQLNDYINDNIDSCINFEEFRKQGFEFEVKEEPKAEVVIRDSDVVVVLDYPINVKRAGAEKELSRFIAQVPVNIKSVYELGSTIASLQSEYRYLERGTLNLVTAFSGLDNEKLPPMSASSFNIGPGVTWRLSDVEDDVGGILTSYTSLLQTQGTHNYNLMPASAGSLADSLYNKGMIIPMDKFYPELSVNFDYVGWPLYFKLNCPGGICRPESVTANILSLIGFKKYSFVYDLSYPVMVEIRDDKALNGKGYTFRFFLESNIRRNEPMEQNYLSMTGAAVNDVSMLCDENKRNSGNIAANVKDGMTGQPLDDVLVSFACTGETCLIGSTDDEGKLESGFPVCIGGVVTFAKDEYPVSSMPLNTELDKDDSILQVLEPFREKEVVVMKKRMAKQNDEWVFSDNPVYLYDKEQVMMTFTKKTKLGEQKYTTMLLYNQSDVLENKIKLVPGEYDVNINLMQYEEIVVPGGEFCYCSGTDVEVIACEAAKLVGIEPETCEEVQNVVFNETNPYPSGGLDLKINIGKDDLDSSKRITFYVISPDLKMVNEELRTIDDLEQIGMIENYSDTYSQYLQPGFK